MIVAVGLLARITAVVLAVTSGTGGSGGGGTQPLSDNFVTFGQHLTESRRHRSARAPRIPARRKT